MQLIDDLLDVSRIVNGKLRMRWRAVPLVEVIRSALESVNAQAERKAIRFKVTLAEDVEPVYGDATRLQQVFWNLLNNAIKFSAQGGEVIVTLETEGGQARVRVSDQGAGIDPEFLPRMWSHFTQEDSSNARGYGGLGLGLAIVQHLVQVHGGTVSAESAGKNQGATFWVTIPVSSAHLQQPALRSVTAASSAGQSARKRDRHPSLARSEDPARRRRCRPARGGGRVARPRRAQWSEAPGRPRRRWPP